MLSIFLLGLVIAVVIMGILSNYINANINGKILSMIILIVVCISMFLSLKAFTNIIWYNYDNKDVASKGVFFKDSLILSEHILIGSSDYVILKIDKYSRSDRQLEVINVIVNDNKSKDIIKWAINY